MKIYSIPQNLKTIIFDIDGTLYTSPEYVFEQIDVQIRHFAALRKISEQEARELIYNYRRKWSLEHNGKKISLGNTFTAFGISIEESIKWRNALMEPEKYLKKDIKLRKALLNLKQTYKLICVTNNPVNAAFRTLQTIGIDDVIPDIIGLDTCFKSKPNREVLERAAKDTNAVFSECLSVGDRYDIDLALPLELGMGAILVDGAEDVCRLQEILHL